MIGELFQGNFHADSMENMGGLIADRIPKPVVSAMDNLLTGFNFIVSLNGFTYGFQSVSNLQRHREVRYYQEGGVNDHQIMVGAPNDNTYTLSLRRGYIIHAPDDVMYKLGLAAAARIPNELARKAAIIAVSSSSPQVALENGPATGFIQVYSRRKKLVAMFSFLSLGMTEWTFSNLDAQSSEALFEEITLAHTGLTLLPATWMPSVAQPVMGWAGATEDSMATMAAIMEQNKKDFEKRQKELKRLEEDKKALDEERLDLLHRRDEIIAERAKKAEEKKKKVEDEKKSELDSIKDKYEKAKEAQEAENKKRKEAEDERKREREAKEQERKDKYKEMEKAKEEQAKANAEALKARQEEAKKSEEARKETEKAKEEQAKANAEALKARQEEAKKSEEARKETEKAKEEQAKANAEALKARQEQQKSDYDRRMDAQKARTERQNAQDKENVEKVEKANAEAEARMKNEKNE